MRVKVFLGVCVAGAFVSGLVLMTSASAAPIPPTYLGVGGNVQSQVQGTEASNTLGSLPFTGLDLSLIVGAALVLLIAGVSLRRLASRRA